MEFCRWATPGHPTHFQDLRNVSFLPVLWLVLRHLICSHCVISPWKAGGAVDSHARGVPAMCHPWQVDVSCNIGLDWGTALVDGRNQSDAIAPPSMDPVPNETQLCPAMLGPDSPTLDDVSRR